MIRPINISDDTERDELEKFLRHHAEMNILQLGYLCTIPATSKSLQFWGQFQGKKRVASLMRYQHRWCIDDREESTLNELAEIIDDYSSTANGALLHDNTRTAPSLMPLSKKWYAANTHNCIYREIVSKHFRPLVTEFSTSTRLATEDDLDRLTDLHKDAGMFTRTREQLMLLLALGRIYVVEKEGTLVSSVAATVETDDMVMMEMAYTPSKLRGRGYIEQAITTSHQELLNEGKKLLMYTEHAAIMKLTQQMGYSEIGPWRWIQLKKA